MRNECSPHTADSSVNHKLLGGTKHCATLELSYCLLKVVVKKNDSGRSPVTCIDLKGNIVKLLLQ